jgi:hypothetical protein
VPVYDYIQTNNRKKRKSANEIHKDTEATLRSQKHQEKVSENPKKTSFKHSVQYKLIDDISAAIVNDNVSEEENLKSSVFIYYKKID